MKTASLLATSILTSMFLMVQPAMAAQGASRNSTASTSALSNQTAQQLKAKASEILGNINIANVALAYGMNDDASSHIATARQAIKALNGQMAADDAMTAGKIHYKTAQGESDYWIPVVNDHFVVRTLDGKHFSAKNPEIDVTDAQTVHVKMVLDSKIADEQLAKAQTAISKKQYNVAVAALQNVTQATITETVVKDKPLESARDNLILSRELLHDKDYSGASFALKHANNDLAQVEKANPGRANDTTIKYMQAQINMLQASIAKEDPSMLKTAEMKIEGWIKDVKAKILGLTH